MSRILRGQAVVLALVAALAPMACGTTGPGPVAGKNLEKSALKVGVLPIPDAAPLYIAEDKGFFRQEGLIVEPVVIRGGAEGLPLIRSGALDITLANYVSTFMAAEKGEPVKVVADLYHAGPKTFQLMVPGDSPIRDVAGLKGKTVLVNTEHNIGTLVVTATLARAGVAPGEVRFATEPFPAMAGALTAGEGDAAWMTEPFITAGERRQGLRPLADTMTGELRDLPVAGWVVTERWAADHPRALAGFRRAVAKGQRLAATSRDEVVAVLPSYTRIGEVTARQIALGRYPLRPEPAELQRVAVLMLRYGYLRERLDVRSVLLAD
ncbi:ABC transporter substrate-binding protein [Nonomuraea sp. NPDC049649]|uniref:ABC transporter substrate-binding protein n=1 Tax=Nonomuraea sp. NPDC049649 TaxID=3155776 RepID=UPI00342C04C7